jgi:hypothetical protein
MRLRKLLACTVLAYPRIRNVNFPSSANSKPLWVLPEIVWVLGRTWVVPKGVPSFVRRGAGR